MSEGRSWYVDRRRVYAKWAPVRMVTRVLGSVAGGAMLGAGTALFVGTVTYENGFLWPLPLGIALMGAWAAAVSAAGRDIQFGVKRSEPTEEEGSQ